MYNYIYIYHLGIHTCIYTQCMHTYIYIVYMHIYIYMHIYTCTHCMVTTTPHAATLLHQSSNTHTALYIYTCSSYKHTHTHSVSTYAHNALNHYNSLALTGHQPRCVGPVLALHQHHLSMQAQTGMIAG